MVADAVIGADRGRASFEVALASEVRPGGGLKILVFRCRKGLRLVQINRAFAVSLENWRVEIAETPLLAHPGERLAQLAGDFCFGQPVFDRCGDRGVDFVLFEVAAQQVFGQREQAYFAIGKIAHARRDREVFRKILALDREADCAVPTPTGEDAVAGRLGFAFGFAFSRLESPVSAFGYGVQDERLKEAFGDD